MNNEKIKIGETTLDVAAGSCSLDRIGNDTATVAIIIGSNTIDNILAALASGGTIVKYDRDGTEEWKKDNLIFTGVIKPQSEFPVGIEEKQIGTDDKPVYSIVEVMGSVLVVEYRLPTMQDEINRQSKQIVGLNAQVAYLSMMSGIDIEEV
ncbi:hypothetical protein [Lacrimispora sp.]|uniref:hypothetical protein n=1 Tax=Lacrimispora sp. TaxID=2719234 RepID=UPI0028ADC459|nr:hypothetical protein [Lacrimispora sp.]